MQYHKYGGGLAAHFIHKGLHWICDDQQRLIYSYSYYVYDYADLSIHISYRYDDDDDDDDDDDLKIKYTTITFQQIGSGACDLTSFHL